MSDEVDKIKLDANTDAIDEAISKLEKLEDKLDSVDKKEVKPAIGDGSKKASDDFKQSSEQIEDDLKNVDDKLEDTGDKISKTGKELGGVFKKATLTILGTAAAIGLASKRLNQMKADAISANISVRQAQIGGGAFEVSGVDSAGYTASLANLRNVKSDLELGKADSEFLRRLALLGLDGSLIKKLSPEKLADTIIKAAENKTAQNPSSSDVVRSNVQVLLGEDFAKVFDYNQSLGRSWEELKSEFSKFAFISDETTKANAELATEIGKTGTFFKSLGAEISGAFAEHFEEPLERLNNALVANTDAILKFLDSTFGVARDAGDGLADIITKTIEMTDTDGEIGISGTEALQLPVTATIGILDKLLDATGLTEQMELMKKNMKSPDYLQKRANGTLQSMERSASNIQNNQSNSSTSVNSPSQVIIQGPVVNIENGSANLNAREIGMEAEKAIRNTVLPSIGSQPSE